MDLYYRVSDNKYSSIKQLLKEKYCISSRLYLKLKREKHIYLNSVPISYDSILKINDTVEIDLEFDEDNSNIVSTKMPLNILYEDKYMLIINKEPFIPVHPSILHYDNSLSNGVKCYYDNVSLHKKIRIVNRLDKDTSGIVIFAKNEYIQECMILQMKNNLFKKEYVGILEGNLKEKFGIIDAPISRKEGSIIERCISENGQRAITHFEVIEEINNLSVVHFALETGRTHQIRVHSSYIGHPLLGDTLYGSPSALINRQALHAYKISFIHPITNKNLVIKAPIPSDIEKILQKKRVNL